MSKEFSLPSPKSPELMQSLLESFGRNNWVDLGPDGTDPRLVGSLKLKRYDGKKFYLYTVSGSDSNDNLVEISLYTYGRLSFNLLQVAGNKDTSHIQFYISKKEEDLGWLLYDSNGNLTPAIEVKKVPKKIDVDATASAFLLQVIHGDFFTPQLIKAKK